MLPIPNQKAYKVKEVLFENDITRFGVPHMKFFYSDRPKAYRTFCDCNTRKIVKFATNNKNKIENPNFSF